MLKFVANNVLDAALNDLATADKLVLCEGQPADYTDATTDKGSGGHALGENAVTFTGPADGDTSGRKITADAISGITVDVTGVCDYQVLIDDGNSELLLAAPMAYSAITGVDTGTDTVTIDGDHTGDISTDDNVTIRESTGNDGLYTVSSVSLNGSDTDVVLNESIGDSTANGYMIYGATKLSSGNSIDTDAFDEEILDATI